MKNIIICGLCCLFCNILGIEYGRHFRLASNWIYAMGGIISLIGGLLGIYYDWRLTK